MNIRIPLLVASLGLAACDGDVSLAITDAPVDEVERVVIRVTAVTFNPVGGTGVRVALDSATDVPISTLTGGATLTLIDGEDLAAGSYSSVDLEIEADTQELDSFIELEDGSEISLVLAGGADLRARGDFEVEDDESLDLVVEMDLRQSLSSQTNGAGDRLLDPVLRLVQRERTGSIVGVVEADRLRDADCDNGEDNDRGNVIYVWEGANITPDDIDTTAPNPLTTQTVSGQPVAGDSLRYTIAFLEPGSYTLALSCQGRLDDPDSDELIAFIATVNAEVTEGQSTTIDF